MKCFIVVVAFCLVLSAWAQDVVESDLEQVASAPVAAEDQDQVSSASSYAPLQEKKQEKRYVGGYGGYGAGGYGAGGYGGYGAAGYGGYGAGGYGGYGSALGAGYGSGVGVGVDSYYNPYGSRSLGGLGEDGSLAGYGGYGSAVGGYGSALGGGYGSSLGGGYGSSLGGGYGSYNSNPYGLSYYNSRLGAGAGTGYPYYNTRFGAGGYPSSYYTSNYGNSVVGGGLGALGGVPPIGSGYNYGAGISGTVY